MLCNPWKSVLGGNRTWKMFKGESHALLGQFRCTFDYINRVNVSPKTTKKTVEITDSLKLPCWQWTGRKAAALAKTQRLLLIEEFSLWPLVSDRKTLCRYWIHWHWLLRVINYLDICRRPSLLLSGLNGIFFVLDNNWWLITFNTKYPSLQITSFYK